MILSFQFCEIVHESLYYIPMLSPIKNLIVNRNLRFFNFEN